MFSDSLFQDDACQDDGKDGLKFLEQHYDGKVVEMQQKQRLDYGQGAQGTAKEGDEDKINQVRAGHGLQVTVFPEKEHVHQQKGKEVDDEDHESGVEVLELRREQNAVHTPKHGRERNGKCSY